MTDKELKKLIFLKKGKLRKPVLDCLDQPKTASEIAKQLNKHRSAISRTLLDLQKQGLAKCVNPKDNSHRHYVKKWKND